MVKQHRECRSALREASEGGRIAEHLRERDIAFDRLDSVAELHAAHASATGVEAAHDIADILVGDIDFHLHDGLEEHRARLFRSRAERHGTRDSERHFGAVHLVSAAVHEPDLEVHHLVARHDAGLCGFLDALADRVCKLLGDDAADRFVGKFVAAAGVGLSSMTQ